MSRGTFNYVKMHMMYIQSLRSDNKMGSENPFDHKITHISTIYLSVKICF